MYLLSDSPACRLANTYSAWAYWGLRVFSGMLHVVSYFSVSVRPAEAMT